MVALLHFHLDYRNSVLVGIPAYLMRRLRSVLNAAARLTYNLKRSDHISDGKYTVLCQDTEAYPVVLELNQAFQLATWTGSPLCRHQPLSHAACQVVNRRQPSMSAVPSRRYGMHCMKTWSQHRGGFSNNFSNNNTLLRPLLLARCDWSIEWTSSSLLKGWDKN